MKEKGFLKKFISALLIVVFSMSICSCSSNKSKPVPIRDEQVELPDLSNVQVGDCVKFGTYEMNKSNVVINSSPITWDVLSVEDDKILLISHYILDYQRYDGDDKLDGSFKWGESSLREWLNGDFKNTAFCRMEQEQILDTTLRNEKFNNDPTEPFVDEETIDKIFILSPAECLKYYTFDVYEDGQGYCQDMIADPTPHVIEKGIDFHMIGDHSFKQGVVEAPEWSSKYIGRTMCEGYILRSPYEGTGPVVDINEVGMLSSGYGQPPSLKYGIRPALFIKRN